MSTTDATETWDADLDQTGPYCRHWAELGDCEICAAGCANCNHPGHMHEFYGESRCDEKGCECPGWKDKGSEEIR